MKKRKKIIIICLSVILIVAFITLAIMNYIVLPPKVSSNAQKYKYNHNNILKLKSITVDENKVIYEFCSFDKYFRKNYIKRHGEETEYSTYLELHKVVNTKTNESEVLYPKEYKIISTFTSTYLVITFEDSKKPDFIRCNYLGGIFNRYTYLCIAIGNTNGYENLEVGKGYMYPDENRRVGKSQNYDKNKKKWSKIRKIETPFNEYL